ncbi:T9SS type A sorting domain-containing protein [Fluviicola taffensis]|uniref:T9SS type A sorting domain-containing protein n=1 Tax=Fluviicola taffensis TaxID=191579 RepID=UPI0002EA2D4D|nr:T9SS type A sorting domain-containing protein [Fluviicola taffensis]
MDNTTTAESNEIEELIFPNPTTDLLHVALDVGEITIYNAQGQEQKTNVIGTNREYQTLDVSTYASGVYIIVSRKGDAPLKFVKL